MLAQQCADSAAAAQERLAMVAIRDRGAEPGRPREGRFGRLWGRRDLEAPPEGF
jgi:hypothetical protein